MLRGLRGRVSKHAGSRYNLAAVAHEIGRPARGNINVPVPSLCYAVGSFFPSRSIHSSSATARHNIINMLSEIAQASLGRTAAISTILGIGFHAAIQSVEFEVYMFYFLGLTTASWPLLAAFYLQLGQCSIFQALARTALVQVAFHGALLLSIVTYRVAFHRLRRFPGPFGAAVSRWYTLYLASKNVQYHLEVQDMHSKYGDFVRTGEKTALLLQQSDSRRPT